jgi:hypothetical protein
MSDREILCDYCGFPVGTDFLRLKTVGVSRHFDCSLVYRNEVFSERGIMPKYLQIRKADAPKVIILGDSFRKLVRKSLEVFPLQSTQFTVGDYDDVGQLVKVDDFCNIPVLEAVMPSGQLSEWKINNSASAKAELEKILRDKQINGYVHCHDGSYIGRSDLFYDWFLSDALPEMFHKRIVIHLQLDYFTPAMKELILLNHRRFNGSKYLITLEYSVTENLTRYLQPETEDDARLIKEAKKKARRAIMSNPSKHISAFSTVLPEVMGYDSNKEEEIILEELVGRVKGKIKELPLVVS